MADTFAGFERLTDLMELRESRFSSNFAGMLILNEDQTFNVSALYIGLFQ
jgi:hypothetical protein